MYQLIKKHNKSNLFVKECITSALFSLMEKHDFDKITITDIINKAGVSRMGFYRNFTDKENVVEKFVLDKFVETVDDIKSKRALNFHITNIMITTLQNFQKFSKYIKLFLDRNLEPLLYRCYHKAYYCLYEGSSQSRIHLYSNEMFIGELFNLEMCWLKNGMKETPEQMAKIFYRIMRLRCNEQTDVNIKG